MLNSLIVTIDPGASGSMCIMELTHNDIVLDIKFIDFKSLGLIGYINELKNIDYTRFTTPRIGIELVHSMHGQGVKSVFSFGQRLGELIGMLQTLNLGYISISPQNWQKTLKVKPKSGKIGVFTEIIKVYPNASVLGSKGGILDGRCDALGIAHHILYTNKKKKNL